MRPQTADRRPQPGRARSPSAPPSGSAVPAKRVRPWLNRDGQPVSFRVGRRNPDPLWLLKMSPGWNVVFRAPTLAAIAGYLRERDVDLDAVTVVGAGWPWRSLAQHLEAGPP